MLRRTVITVARASRRPFSTTMASSSQSPVEDAIREKITAALNPSTLEIYNDSHKHAHHKAMEGSTSRETHFKLVITSPEFQSKRQPARHRLVYSLLKEEMAREGGIHALQLKTLTPEEEAKQKAEGTWEGTF
ncbi:bola-like protein [Rhypophila decipiens]|uniref:Bola-like protein n=1 Tax=Rhypophila decipiens TaxID=261697 RepID=A0AAN6YFD0_9PEZI|nr:bola-like protein [Rhypophila decipiens]